MTSRRAAGLLFVLPVMVSVSTGSAWAEDPSSTVVKSSTPSTAITTGSVAPGTPAKPQGLTEPQEQLRPSIGDDQPTGAAPPADEIAPSAMDEGAGWEAAVEAAPGATPLIGEQQAKAVQRINAYFNGITNLQGSFDQVDFTNKHTSGRFYVQRPGKIRFDYAPPSALRIVADGDFLAIEDSDLKTVEKYPIQSTPLPPATDRCGRSRPRCPDRRGGKQEGRCAVSLEDNVGDRRRNHQAHFAAGPSSGSSSG